MRFGIAFLSLILLVGAYMVVKNNVTPSLGVDNGLFLPLASSPNGVSTQAQNPEKLIKPLPFMESLEDTKAGIIKACKLYGDCRIVSESENYIHMVFTTGIMKFNDDVEFYMNESRLVVEYRSQSRVGYSDMGLNRERYDSILSSYMKLKEAR